MQNSERKALILIASCKWQVANSETLRVDCTQNCSGAKPILPTCREGDHSLGNLLFLTTLSRINNFLIKIKLGRNGGRYNSHSAKRNISNFRVTKIYRVQRTYRMRSIYRQSICLFYNKLDILLRNSIYKSKDLFDIFC